MNILYLVHQFYPTWRTGTERFVLHVASTMQKWGHRVQVATYDTDSKGRGGQTIGRCQVRRFVYEGLPVIAVRPVRGRSDALSNEPDPDIRATAIRIIAEGNFDLVHVAHPWRMREMILASTRAGLPYLITLTDGWLACPTFLIDSQNNLCGGPRQGIQCRRLCPKWRPSFIRQRLHYARKLLRSARQLISPSVFLADVFRGEWPDLGINIIPHGMDYRYLRRSAAQKPSGAPLSLVYVGTFLPHKGLHVLLQALTRMRSRNWLLDVYGSHPSPSYWRLVQSLAAGNSRIRFRGTFEEQQISRIFKGVDAIVIPSVYLESYCLVLHEALACGVPAIVSDAGHLADAVKDGVHGFQFNTGDADSLAHVLNRIASKRSLLYQIRRHLEMWYPPSIEQEAYAYLHTYSLIVNGA